MTAGRDYRQLTTRSAYNTIVTYARRVLLSHPTPAARNHGAEIRRTLLDTRKFVDTKTRRFGTKTTGRELSLFGAYYTHTKKKTYKIKKILSRKKKTFVSLAVGWARGNAIFISEPVKLSEKRRNHTFVAIELIYRKQFSGDKFPYSERIQILNIKKKPQKKIDVSFEYY